VLRNKTQRANQIGAVAGLRIEFSDAL
jgi:hypothetical protein